MADSEAGEKSEAPSGKKLGRARADGMVGKSHDLSLVVSLTTAFIALKYFSGNIWLDLKHLFITCLSFDTREYPLSVKSLEDDFLKLLLFLSWDILIVMLLIAFFASLSIALQTNFLWSWKLLKPKFSQINPISGIKRLCGTQNVVNILKSIAKLCIIAPISYFAFIEIFPDLVNLINLPLESMMPFIAEGMDLIFWRTTKYLIPLVIADLIWQKYSNYKQLKMTKNEVKDERKSVEGDEATKSQIRARGLARIKQQMMQAIPTADVIITNPTHFAVALKYDPKIGKAPIVVAKGQDHLALRIREIAKEHNVPILERKELARALYKAVDVGKDIPWELYRAVAEILAYVYTVKGRRTKLQRSDRAL